jgi:metallophosphoesterase (TIGR00282 family)
MKNIRVLAVGDIVGRAGRHIYLDKIMGMKDKYRIDIIVVNGENAAGGYSINQEIVHDIFKSGASVITTGNHIWDNKDIASVLDREQALIRPANYPPGAPGNGYYTFMFKGTTITVMNLLGRALMEAVDCPFRKFDEIYEEVKDESDIIILDFHAESTSEKKAMGWYVDGKISALFGTHTHVQTSDEEILPQGTGYITDAGMTGAFDSVIGMRKEESLERFLTQRRVRFEPAKKDLRINGILFDINSEGKTVKVERIIERA